jgi:hypothetical protein
VSRASSNVPRSIPVLLGVPAAILGVGGIAAKVKQIVQAMSKPVNRAVDWVIDKIVGLVKKLWSKIKGRFEKKKPKPKPRPKRRPDRKRPGRPRRQRRPDQRRRRPDQRKAEEEKLAWWRLKDPFKLRDGESHTAAFRGTGESAALVIRSDEKDYRSYISSVPVPASEPDRQKTRAAALRTTGEIETLIQVLKKRRPSKKNLTKLSVLTHRLTQQTAELLGDQSTKPKSTPPIYGPLSNDGAFGTSVTVTILTDKDRTKGSPAKSGLGGSKAWGDMEPRYHTGKRYYQLGHLLHKDLGGPGNKWENLTPLTTSANAQHLADIESKIIRLVNQENKGVHYSVRTVYHRKAVPATQTAKYAEFWRTKSGDSPDVVNKKTAIVRAERHVATEPAWEYKIVRPESAGAEGKSGSVKNEPEQVAEEYRLR